jgi:single-strand DNA-binding protein
MNHVILIGRLTKDAVSKQTQTGKGVTSFTLAVNRNKDEVDFINCVAWEKTADIVTRYTRKGSQIAVEGRINTRSYDDKDKKKVYVTEVVVSNVQLLDADLDIKDLPPLGDDLPF